MVIKSTTSYSPFEFAYGFNPFSPLDLFPLPIMPHCVNDEGLSKAKFVQIYMTWTHMEKKGEKYAKNANKWSKDVSFKEGDLVWVHLRKEQFPHLRNSKLLPRRDDPFKIIKKLNDNAYKVTCPKNLGEVILSMGHEGGGRSCTLRLYDKGCLKFLSHFWRILWSGLFKAQIVKDLLSKACSKIDKKVGQYANKSNKGNKQRVFEEGDLLRVHLRNERFSNLRKSKLLPRGDGPFKVLAKVNDNVTSYRYLKHMR
ncbi:hypothetical protein CR513_10148, partial [Mucuna pruriens]